jgi:hypothetical protein
VEADLGFRRRWRWFEEGPELLIDLTKCGVVERTKCGGLG